MSGATGLKSHFRARWIAVKAKRLRECGVRVKDIAAALGIEESVASRFARWDGESPLQPRHTRKKATP